MGQTQATTVPDYYAREVEEREKILDACPIDIYTSSINPRWAWPWKLNASNEARPSTRKSCRELMIDPGIRNPACSPEIGNAAAKTDADYVLARDLSPEHPHHGERDDRNLRSVETAVNYYYQHKAMRTAETYKVGKWECAHDANVIIPIQPPYDVSIDYMSRNFERHELVVDEDDGTVYYADDSLETINLIRDVDYFAVGGLLDFPVDDRIEQLRMVRDILGPDVKLHALAPGTDAEIVAALRDDPDLIDSLDVSTPENAVKNGKVADMTGTQHKVPFPHGTDSTTVRASWSAAIAEQFAYALSPKCSDDFDDL